MKDRTFWNNFTSTICHWNQNNERKNKLYCSFLSCEKKNWK